MTKSKGDYKPAGFHSVTPYMTVKDAAKLLEFVKQVFGAEELGVYRGPEGRINHGQCKVGDSMIEFSEGSELWPAMPCALHVYVPDVDATHQRAVQAGAESLQEPTDQFYGERSSAVRDMCGNNWYIATQTEVLTREEIEKRIVTMAGQKS